MTRQDIEVLMKGIAPVVLKVIEHSIAPLNARIEALETDLAKTKAAAKPRVRMPARIGQ